ncbi:MAG: protease inhibitor I42 family protein [Nitrospira sp.]
MSSSLGQDAVGAVPREEQRVIDIVAGRPFRLHLWEDRTRGEQWVPSYDTTAFALLDDQFLRIASNNAVDTGRRTFEFEGMRPGSFSIVFEKRMGWKFTAEDRRVFTVHVTDSRKG